MSQFRARHLGVPVLAQGKRIRLGIMRLRVRFLALLSGLRIQLCRELWYRSQTWFTMSCGVGHRRGLKLHLVGFFCTLVWIWCCCSSGAGWQQQLQLDP